MSVTSVSKHAPSSIMLHDRKCTVEIIRLRACCSGSQVDHMLVHVMRKGWLEHTLNSAGLGNNCFVEALAAHSAEICVHSMRGFFVHVATREDGQLD